METDKLERRKERASLQGVLKALRTTERACKQGLPVYRTMAESIERKRAQREEAAREALFQKN